MNQNDIYEENNFYIIKKEIDNEWVNFGVFSNLDEAIKKRDELEEDGWPYLKKNSKYDKIEKYIYKKENRFLVSKKILDKNIIFGNFDSYDKAKKFKRKLIDNAWNVNSMNASKKYGKYIQKSNSNFIVAKKFDNKFEYFGKFKYIDDAIFKRNQLIDNNWGKNENTILENIGVHELKGLDDKNIGKVGRKYTVYIWKNNNCHILGFYSNYKTATLVRNKFVLNNSIDYGILDKSQKDTKYIIKVSDYYRISKMINGKIRTFGHYDTLDKAIKVRDLLIKNKWDEKFISKQENYNDSVHKHIHTNSRGYSVVNRINGQLINFGTFKNLNEAINYRDELEDNNWLKDYNPNEEDEEEKYDEYIYLKNDGYYYLKYEIEGEIKIFGIFDNPLDAIAARLDCLKNNWDTFSISEEEYINSNYNYSDLPFGSIINDKENDEIEDITYSKDFNNFLEFPVTVGKSYKNKGWAIKRSYINNLVPILKYEKFCEFLVEGFVISGKINIHTRLFYNNNKELSNYLLKLYKIDSKIQSRIILDLTYGAYELNPNLEGKLLNFTTKFSKTFKNGMFVIPRDYSKKILPILPYESNAYFLINNINCIGKFNLEFRVQFKNNELINYLNSIKKDDDDLEIFIKL